MTKVIQTDKEIKLSRLKVADILHKSYNGSISCQCGKCKNMIVIFDDRNMPLTQDLNMKLVFERLVEMAATIRTKNKD